MSDAITVVIPGTPDKRLAPNAVRRIHFHERNRLSGELRDTGMLAALAIRPHGRVPMFSGDVVLEETIYWGKGERRIDLDGIPLMLKSALDGLCDAGLLSNDSQVKKLVTEQYRDAQGLGRVELVITEWTHWHTSRSEV